MEPVRGMELLWQPSVVEVYLLLLNDASNPETLEAAAGAIQNLAACDWQVCQPKKNVLMVCSHILIPIHTPILSPIPIIRSKARGTGADGKLQ